MNLQFDNLLLFRVKQGRWKVLRNSIFKNSDIYEAMDRIIPILVRSLHLKKIHKQSKDIKNKYINMKNSDLLVYYST